MTVCLAILIQYWPDPDIDRLEHIIYPASIMSHVKNRQKPAIQTVHILEHVCMCCMCYGNKVINKDRHITVILIIILHLSNLETRSPAIAEGTRNMICQLK